ncbi:hypothetical protein BKA93DRAFT_827423 [Sparassis latifolia]
MVHCLWGVGIQVDTDSKSSEEEPEPEPEPKELPEVQDESTWSNDSESEMAFATQSVMDKSSWAYLESYTKRDLYAQSMSPSPDSPLFTTMKLFEMMNTPSAASPYLILSSSPSIPSLPVIPEGGESLQPEESQRPKALTLCNVRSIRTWPTLHAIPDVDPAPALFSEELIPRVQDSSSLYIPGYWIPILSEKLQSYDMADAKGRKTLVQSLCQKLKTHFVDASNYDDIIVETEKVTKKCMHVSGKPNAFKVWDALERDKVTEAMRALMVEKGCNVSKEEQKAYEEKVESWQNGTLDDKMKMKLREQRMMQYLKKFAKTMWDTMGVHMAFMLAYPKEVGSLKVEMVEVNHAITNGTPFGAYPGWLCAYQPSAKVFSEWAKGEYGVTETMVMVKKTPAIACGPWTRFVDGQWFSSAPISA